MKLDGFDSNICNNVNFQHEVRLLVGQNVHHLAPFSFGAIQRTHHLFILPKNQVKSNSRLHIMVSIGLSFASLVIIIACAIIVCQYLYSQWIRYRNPFHGIIVFFKSCFRGQDVRNDEISVISLHSTHVLPTVDGARRLSRVSDMEVRRVFVRKYIIQKVGSCS